MPRVPSFSPGHATDTDACHPLNVYLRDKVLIFFSICRCRTFERSNTVTYVRVTSGLLENYLPVCVCLQTQPISGVLSLCDFIVITQISKGN